MPTSSDFDRRLRALLPDLVQQYGTPFHLYDERGILATHAAITAAFAGVDYRQYFAVKALPNPAILRMLTAAGSGLDCASPAELELARRTGAVGTDVVFTSNNTTTAEYSAAQEFGAIITLDDRAMLDRLDTVPETVCFRAAPNGIGTDSRLMGDAAHTKFGVPIEELPAAYRQARARGARRFGIHAMMFANELDLSAAIRATRAVLTVAADVARAAGIRFDFVNLGGGLGIPYLPGDRPFDLPGYAHAVTVMLAELFGTRSPQVLTEYGRYVTGPHGVLVTRVVGRYDKARETVGLDASMPALMRPALYGAYHHISLPFAGERSRHHVDVVGSLCENMDKFATDRELPRAEPGDIAVIHDTGAHGHAMGYTYNGRLRPAELLLTADGDVVEIRRAETFDDYVATVRWDPQPVPLSPARTGDQSPHPSDEVRV
ncbi:diaminopimelate decarboxylase [Nocardia thailandica]|uniref:diaminopimelate decarboxylase n=1 Tax=Nocardia thailandica TaxID=257275 RepID=UPI00030D9CAF|nr:diaminopimelate decarboxylase [Nocardia thailandica]